MSDPKHTKPEASSPNMPLEDEAPAAVVQPPPARPRLDPTRYGDWELNGKCVDF